MERTAEEIMKGLECCGESQDCTQDNMPKCPYYEKETCLIELVDDALALIKQLQAENVEKDQRIRQLEAERYVLDYTLAGVMHSVDKWLDVEPYKMDGPTGNDAVTRSVLAREIALKAIEQAQAERDAAVKSLRGRCFECKHNKTSVCLICSKDKELKYWQWRGVQT